MPAPGPIQRVTSLFPSFHPGPRLIDGQDLRNMVNLLFTSAKAGLTALAGGGLSAATPIITNNFNQVDTVATANDSIQLPAAVAGQTFTIFNNGANSLQVFGLPTDSMIAQGNRSGAAVAGSVGLAVASGACSIFTCFQTSTWKQCTF